jgi:Tautomerase enzyme
MKKKFYKRIADEIHERTGVRKEDVWINLVDDAGGRTGLSSTARCKQNSANFAVIIPTLIIEVTPVNNQVIKRAAAQASRPHLG